VSSDLKNQVRGFSSLLMSSVEPVGLHEIKASSTEAALVKPNRLTVPPRRGWVVVAAAAAAALVLFGGLVVLTRTGNSADAPPVVDQIEPEDLVVVNPAETDEPEATEQAESEEPPGDNAGLVDAPWSIADLPQGAEWGTLTTPLGAANWVRLSADQVGLPALGKMIPWPSGFAIFDNFQLWISDNGIEWRTQPLPLDPGQEAKLTFDDGVYWLIATDGQWTRTTSGFWRSTDGLTWDVVDPQGLLPPGPTGFLWFESHTGPVTAGELTLSYAFYEWHVPLNDYLPVLIDDYDPDRDEGCRELRAQGAGVFQIVGQQEDQGCPHQLALRFEEADPGLRVFDNATGEELGEILGADLSHIDRLAQNGDAVTEERLLIIQDNEITPIENPLPGRFPHMLGVQDTIYAYVDAFDTERQQISVWRTTDGRTWTDLGPPSFPQGTAQTEYMNLTSFRDSVVVTLSRGTGIQNCASSGLRCLEIVETLETTDGINWSPSRLVQERPDQIHPIRLDSGWFGNDGASGDNSEGDWWMGAGDAWVSLADLGIELRVNSWPIPFTGTQGTTFFFGESTMSILNLDPTG